MIHRNRKVHKFVIFVSWAGIFSAIALLLLFGYWLFAPYNIADVKQPFRVLNEGKIVNINDRLKLEISFTKYLAEDPVTYPSIRCDSGNLVALASNSNSTLPVGSYTIVSDRIVLPPKFQVGDKCQFVSTQVYKVNPIRKITYEFVSEYFTIGQPI